MKTDCCKLRHKKAQILDFFFYNNTIKLFYF